MDKEVGLETGRAFDLAKIPLESPSLGAQPDEHEDERPEKSLYQKVYNAFGFQKAYNFPLYVIFAGAMLGLGLSRLEDYNFDGIFAKNDPDGDYYYYRTEGLLRTGMIMHLAGAIPAAILMVLQFTPIIRHKFMLFHRINGYLVLSLIIVSHVGVCIILRRPTGGDVAQQTIVATLVIMTTLSAAMAIWNVKRLQIDQHRAWMLRAMFYMGTTITFRLVLFAGAAILGQIDGFYNVWECDKIDWIYQQYGVNNILATKYPQCLVSNGTLDGEVVVPAAVDPTAPESSASAVNLMFGVSLWVSLVLHLVGLEIYLALTPRESARLRQVSYEKQLAAGYKNPGHAGFTVEGWGDADPWQPAASKNEDSRPSSLNRPQ